MDESLVRDEAERLSACFRGDFIGEHDRRVQALRADGKHDEAAALVKRRAVSRGP
jgi:hypothetical protein